MSYCEVGVNYATSTVVTGCWQYHIDFYLSTLSGPPGATGPLQRLGRPDFTATG
jgi:hypothetical protein